jgi:hypothetical protein
MIDEINKTVIDAYLAPAKAYEVDKAKGTNQTLN